MADADWRGGRYYGRSFPHRGQKIAREMGTITYRSGPEWQNRFGRARTDEGSAPRLDEDFEVERYLVHQGEKFCLQYDANSYLYISKAMDLFDLTDPSRGQPAIERIACPALVIGVSSDLLFPVWQQRELASALRKQGAPVTYVELDAPYGHDTFLIDRERVGGAVKAHLEDAD
jgi:homoserine O-acetyltransferase